MGTDSGPDRHAAIHHVLRAAGSKSCLQPGSSQAIPPTVEHEVQLLGPVRFTIDFLAVDREGIEPVLTERRGTRVAILPVGPAFFAPNVAQSSTGVRTVPIASKQPRTETFASYTGVAGFGGKRFVRLLENVSAASCSRRFR